MLKLVFQAEADLYVSGLFVSKKSLASQGTQLSGESIRKVTRPRTAEGIPRLVELESINLNGGNMAKELKVKRGTARRAKRVGIPTKGSEQRAEWDKAKAAKTTPVKE